MTDELTDEQRRKLVIELIIQWIKDFDIDDDELYDIDDIFQRHRDTFIDWMRG